MDPYLIYLFVGIFAGVSAGFFGIGGGSIVVPLLVALGDPIKSAIGLSAMQMSFSSVYGTYLNAKSKLLDPKPFFYLGVSGIVGAMIGASLLDLVPALFVAVLLSIMLFISLARTIFINPVAQSEALLKPSVLFVVGLVVGVLSGMVGVGGGFIVVPLLAGFMSVQLKKAVAVGLYYVMFVGTSAFFTLLYFGYVDLIKGALLSIGSIAGVRFGIFLVSKTSGKRYKWMVVGLYMVLLSVMIYKIIEGIV